MRKKEPIRHATIGGYAAHKRRGETACVPCRNVWRDYYRKDRAVRGRSQNK